MKRSDINYLIASAKKCFEGHGWALPPEPRWDVTDLGLGDWRRFGLVLVNLAEEPEYCEKLMYAQEKMVTPAHTHKTKKEDIICRWGKLAVQVWQGLPNQSRASQFTVPINSKLRAATSGDVIILNPGWRITLAPGIYHAFHSLTPEIIIGEVSTANDDVHDNFFANAEIGRFPGIEEDEPATVKLISDK